MPTSFKPVAEQLAYLKKGVAEIIREEELRARLEKSFKTGVPLRVYLGVDPTAPDIHLGHTVVLRKLKHFQDMGHTAIFLIGDFSAMIGDPTGRSETRPPLSREEVNANAKTYLDQVFKILDKDKTEVRYNSEWLDKLSSYDIVRLCGHYQLSRLLEREDFRRRLESGQEFELRKQRREMLRSQIGPLNPQATPDPEARKSLAAARPAEGAAEPEPISVHELLYPLLTALDAVELKSDVELGATEQKFNLLVHRDIQREYGLEGQVCVTMPILVGLDGSKKMSKSLSNYVGITESPSEIFEKLMSIPDELMWSYLELLTDRGLNTIENLKTNVQAGTTHPKQVKVSLASEVVRDFCGEEAALKAAANWDAKFSRREVPEDTPVKELPKEDNAVGSKPGKMKLSRVLLRLEAAPSRAEAERLIKQGAVELNGTVVTDVAYEIDIETPARHLLRVGKKQLFYFLVQ